MNRLWGVAAVVVGLAPGPALAQVESPPVAAPGTDPGPAIPAEADGAGWTYSASVFGYLVPDDQDYAQPTLTADRGWLHLEARYNYEALETGSLWVGYNISVGETVSVDVTPMLGGVFGDLNGVAPGFEFTVGFWKLELYSEGEYVVATSDSSLNFFYLWTEISLSPVDWFRVGLVAQRTRAFESDVEVQRGFLVGVSYRWADFSAYLFNPGQDQPTVVLALGATF